MNKVLFVLGMVFLVATEANAKCGMFDYSKCPKDIQCPAGTMMSNEGKCIDCYSEEVFDITCIGLEKANQSCPNRFYSYESCGTYSYLKCPTGRSNNCDELKLYGSVEEGKCRKYHDNKCYQYGKVFIEEF